MIRRAKVLLPAPALPRRMSLIVQNGGITSMFMRRRVYSPQAKRYSLSKTKTLAEPSVTNCTQGTSDLIVQDKNPVHQRLAVILDPRQGVARARVLLWEHE
jgi:hypothetical protein